MAQCRYGHTRCAACGGAAAAREQIGSLFPSCARAKRRRDLKCILLRKNAMSRIIGSDIIARVKCVPLNEYVGQIQDVAGRKFELFDVSRMLPDGTHHFEQLAS